MWAVNISQLSYIIFKRMFNDFKNINIYVMHLLIVK